MITFATLAARLHALSIALDTAALQCVDLDVRVASELTTHAAALLALSQLTEQKRHLDPLPPAQARVLTYVRLHIKAHGHAPTRQEIAIALGFKSANGAASASRAQPLQAGGFAVRQTLMVLGLAAFVAFAWWLFRKIASKPRDKHDPW